MNDKDTITVAEFTADGIIETKVSKSELVCQPLNKCCVNCGGYTESLRDNGFTCDEEHGKDYCFMCLFGGKAD